MAQYNDLSVLNGLTKTVYGSSVHQAVPDNVKEFFDMFPFVKNSERLGALFAESVNLSIEQGFTRASGSAGVVTLNNSIASVNKQATVDGTQIIGQVTASWDLVAKARQNGSAQSFKAALTDLVDNVLLSHRRQQVMDMLYGGTSLAIIGTGATSATQTITNASCAAGIWYGSTNMLVDIWDPTLTTKRNASPLSLTGYSVDASSSSRTLTFGASVTTTTNDVVVLSGTVAANAYTTPPGLAIISGQTGGTLFGLSQVTYPVFQATQYAVSGALTLAQLDQATVLPMTRGYVGKINLLCNPRTFSNLMQEEVARVHFTSGNTSGTAKIGYNKMDVVGSNGNMISIIASPWIKEGEAYLVPDDGTVKRIGAVDIQLGGPADPQPNWRRIEGATGYSLPTYSLQALFTPEPWKLVKLTNITNT